MRRRLFFKALIAGMFFLPLIPLYFTNYPQYWLAPALEKFCAQSFTGLKCRLHQGKITWAGWRHPFSGRVEMLEFQYAKGVVTFHDVLFSGPVPILQPSGKISLHCAQVQIDSPSLFPRLLIIEKLNANLTVQPDEIILRDLHFTLDEAEGQLEGEMQRMQDENWQLTLRAEVRHALFEKLAERWPISLAPTPRKWVLNNLPKGQVDRAHLVLQSHLTPTAFLLEDVHGQIEAHGVEVHYLGDLPAVHQVKGVATYTTKDFRIHIQEGQVWGIKLPEGQIHITGLDEQDQYINIDLNLNGPIDAALRLLDQKPLHFSRKLKLSADQVTGEAITDLHLYFLLETDTPLNEIQVSAKSQLFQVEFDTKKMLGDRPLLLTAKQLDLIVDKHHFTVQGLAALNQWQGDLLWEEMFQEDRRTYRFNTTLSLASLKEAGWELYPYLKDDVHLKLAFYEKLGEISRWEALVDLTPATVEGLGWTKPRGEAATLQIKGCAPFVLEDFKLQGGGCHVDAAIQGNHFQIQPSFLGRSFFQGYIKDLETDSPIVVIKASALDLSFLLRRDELTAYRTHFNFDLSVMADRIIFTPDLTLEKGDVKAFWKDGQLKQLEVQAHTGKDHKPFQVHIKDDQVLLKTSAGGRFLEAFGTGYDLREGNLVIKGTRTFNDAGDWTLQGKMELDDVHVYQAPLLSRIFAAASLQGMLELLTGQGITFTKTQGDFMLTSNRLQLDRLKMSNNGLGLLVSGIIDYSQRQTDIQGELYPFYFFNHFLAQIPFIGYGLSGGNPDGVFATTFALMGSFDDLTLTVNPFITVAPGVFRRVWGS